MLKRSITVRLGILSSLMLMAMPMAASALTANTTVSSVIGSSISLLSTSGTVNVNVTPTAGGAQTTAADTVTVSTNDTAGYTLKMSSSSATTSLVSGSNNVTATTGTAAAPVALTSGQWGYRVDGQSGFGAGPTSAINSAAIGTVTYAGVPASTTPVTLLTTATTASNAATSVWYSVAANTSVPSGTYTGTVTYTATAN